MSTCKMCVPRSLASPLTVYPLLVQSSGRLSALDPRVIFIEDSTPCHVPVPHLALLPNPINRILPKGIGDIIPLHNHL